MQLTRGDSARLRGDAPVTPARDDAPPPRGRTWWWITAAVIVSVLLRVRMLFTPINADEGGYLAIARAWAHGRVLYRDVWVDRPQVMV
jgi:hypothetical protein